MQKAREKTVFVCVGRIPDAVFFAPVFPKERQQEIDSCKNERVRREKFCAWKLLEYALQEVYGKRIEDCAFQKLSSGKWTAQDCCFSLTHAGTVVAVAVAEDVVGIDVERVRETLLRLKDKFLNERESTEYARLTAEDKEKYLLKKWTQKESIFKAYGQSGFVPREIDTDGYSTQTREIVVQGETFFLSVAGDEINDVRVKLVEEYL